MQPGESDPGSADLHEQTRAAPPDDAPAAAAKAAWATLDAALASMADGVYISDATGNPVDVNDACATLNRLAGRGECLKTYREHPGLFDVFFEDWQPAPLDMWAVPRALRGETASNVLYGVSRKVTGERWIASQSFGPIR
jgi:PAS domain-containing protein